jgi:hypothetical protein
LASKIGSGYYSKNQEGEEASIINSDGPIKVEILKLTSSLSIDAP